MSLLKFLSSDPNAIMNEYKQSVSHPQSKKITLYVEGQSDIKLFRNLVNEDIVELIPVEGKKNVINVMRGLCNSYPEKVYAVCDADFDHINGIAHNHISHGIFVTDYHDIEIMMMYSSAMTKIFNEKSINNSKYFYDKIFEEVMGVCEIIGRLRFINDINQLKIKFKAMNFNKFIIYRNEILFLEFEVLLSQLIEISTSATCTIESLRQLYEQSLLENYDRKQLCCGHDCSNALAIYFRESANIQGNNFKKVTIEKELMLAFTEYNKYEVFRNVQKLA